jgi:methionyl aminopeptidase
MQCPVCQKSGLSAQSHFCSQDCFKACWTTHKLHHPGVYEPFPGFKYTGSLRPWPYGPKRTVPKGIERPDYAETGFPKSEMDFKNKAAMMIPILDKEMQEKMRLVCGLAREVLDEAGAAVREGVTGDEIDQIVHEATIKRNAYPSPLNYQGFPRSCCISVNEVICHGIPDSRPFSKGDIVNVDVTIFRDGVHGDLNETYIVGETDEEGRRLVECARESLRLAIEQVRPGVPYKDLGGYMERRAKADNFSVVRNFCGHGIGTLFHGPPNVPHYTKNKAVGIIRAGHVFTIEPMVNVGAWQEIIWPDDWTAVTVDGKRSAQFEHTLLVTENGCEVLTAGADEKRMYTH